MKLNNTKPSGTVGQPTPGIITQKSNVSLGILLYLSFCASNILPVLSLVNGNLYESTMLGFAMDVSDKLLILLVYALFAYIVSRLILRLYMLVISFSMYSILLPQQGFVNTFEFSLIIRNVLLCGCGLLVLNFVNYYSYFRIVAFACNIVMFIVFFSIFRRKYVDKISAPAILRLLFRPFFAYMVFDFIFAMMGVII